ncbi:Maltose regulon regulatory protein MalI (repressor for malXY) [Cronobacter dublinensis 582]|nr:Maltose regulon regulatory protein MalI (repressor for malXY) [Cronobacter dublinensis 582]
MDTVRPDNQQAARLVTEHLIRRGHQRIAWLGGASSSLTRAERLGGYCATLLQYGLPFHSEWIVECPAGQKPAAEAITELLRVNPTITAVLCHNSTVAMGAWFGLMRAGRGGGRAARRGMRAISKTASRWRRSLTCLKSGLMRFR